MAGQTKSRDPKGEVVAPPPAQPIRTTADNTFAHETMTTRDPRNIRNVIAADSALPAGARDALEQLAREVETDAAIAMPASEWWDGPAWSSHAAPHAGATWHNCEWFFGETYLFRLLLDRARYFETQRDPFRSFKGAGLASGEAFLPLRRFAAAFGDRGAPGITREAIRERLAAALTFSLWGNRADVSFHSGGPLDHSIHDDRRLVRDDRDAIAARLAAANGPVAIVLDNAGAELAADLQLAAEIVELTGSAVHLHAKFYPTYVSDATIADIHATLAAMAAGEQAERLLAARLVAHFERGAIRLAADPAWCEPLMFAQMPPRITAFLARARLVIVKGDFNYRRVFRDTLWPAGIDPRSASALVVDRSTDRPHSRGAAPILAPVTFALLRTMKSDCVVGVAPDRIAELDREETGWRTAGRHGMAQLLPPRVEGTA